MICKNFVYDGYAIPYSPEEARTAGWYGSVQWTNVSTRNKGTAKMDFHGKFYEPTYADERLITITGEIFEQDLCNRDKLVFELNEKFGLVSFPAVQDEWKRLEFEDNCGNGFFFTCKVYKTMQIASNATSCGKISKFTIVLVAKDPFYRYSNYTTTMVNYALYGGIHLDNSSHSGTNSVLPDAMRHLAPETMIENTGTFGAPTVFVLQGAVNKPVFINYTNQMFYGLDLNLSATDTLIIDSEQGTVEVNGGDVSSFRTPGSNLVFLDAGENYVGWTNDIYNYDTASSMQQAEVRHYVTFL